MEIYTFLEDISLKVNVIAGLEFERAYFEAAVQHFSPYATQIKLFRKKVIVKSNCGRACV